MAGFKGYEIQNWADARGIAVYPALQELSRMEHQLKKLRAIRAVRNVAVINLAVLADRDIPLPVKHILRKQVLMTAAARIDAIAAVEYRVGA